MLGFDVSESTVGRYMIRIGRVKNSGFVPRNRRSAGRFDAGSYHLLFTIVRLAVDLTLLPASDQEIERPQRLRRRFRLRRDGH